MPVSYLSDCDAPSGIAPGTYTDPTTGIVYLWSSGSFSLGTLTLINPGFETGDTTGWTATTGSISATTHYFSDVFPRTGSYMQSCLGGGPSVIFHQDVAIPSGSEATIDAGLVTISGVGGYHNPGVTAFGGANDQGRLFLAFVDSAGAVISTTYTSWNTVASTWTHLTIGDTAVPAGTRAIRIGTENIPEDATHDNFWDDFDSPTLTASSGYTPVSSGWLLDYVDVVASETLAAGKFVSFWNSSGAKVRKADNSDNTKQADGWVRQAYTAGQTARVYTGGVNDAVSGLTPGALYFLGTDGGVTTTPPTASGTWLQEIGKAGDATHLPFTNKSGERN